MSETPNDPHWAHGEQWRGRLKNGVTFGRFCVIILLVESQSMISLANVCERALRRIKYDSTFLRWDWPLLIIQYCRIGCRFVHHFLGLDASSSPREMPPERTSRCRSSRATWTLIVAVARRSRTPHVALSSGDQTKGSPQPTRRAPRSTILHVRNHVLAMAVGDLKTDKGVEDLNTYLADRSYIEGWAYF